MNPNVKLKLGTEKMQSDFTLFKELTARFTELRKDSSPAKVKESGIDDLVFKHTGIKIKFSIDASLAVNAYMMPPRLDQNHPFWTSRGAYVPADKGEQGKLGLKGTKTIEVWCDESNYTVGGGWSNVEITLKVLKGLLKLKSISDAGIAAIFLHELGHAYTYFSLFGKLTRKNFLTSEAIKDVMGSPDLEKRVQVLTALEDDLDIVIKDKEELAGKPEKIRGQAIESIVITNSMCNAGSTSSNNSFDVRNIEQIADQFAIYHGAGADLGTAMVEMYRDFGSIESKSNFTFMLVEVIKISFMISVAFISPIMFGICLLLSIPFSKVYDDPEARVELMRKQLVASLRNFKDQKEMHASLMEQIETMEKLKGALKDRRTLYTLIYQTISPRGRSMYRQEVFMKSVENLLFNDTYFNAAKFGALQNEI